MTAIAAARGLPESGEVQIRAGSVFLTGELKLPENATGIVLFAPGSGSSR